MLDFDICRFHFFGGNDGRSAALQVASSRDLGAQFVDNPHRMVGQTERTPFHSATGVCSGILATR